MAPAEFATLFDWDTQQSADSTEWCPLAPHQCIFVCGTYQIEKEETENSSNDNSSPPTSRHGRIYVFQLSDAPHLEPHQVIDLPAVLDMKWAQSYICGKILLGVVTATAKLLIFELKEDRNLVQVAQIDVKGSTDSKEVLALSLDWSCARPSNAETGQSAISIVVSDSQGGANLFSISEGLELVFVKRWQGHDYEAWIAAFNYWNPSILFSGGDDCILNGWDLRSGVDSPIFVNRSHNAGVTSLQSNPLFEHILVSGSYDEKLRIWDLRKMKQPLHSNEMFGGVWRVRWDPFSSDSILTACMHGGFNVVECKDALRAAGVPNLLASYKNHASIAYGADWSHLDAKSVKLLFVNSDFVKTPCMEDVQDVRLISTCSFYDHKLCVSLFSK